MASCSFLRAPLLEDEEECREAHRVMQAEGFPVGLGFELRMACEVYLSILDKQRAGVDLPEGRVPSTFFVAVVGGRIVGRTSIRHRLTEQLAQEGGHIGFCILPQYRRRGYGSEILTRSLVVAREMGLTSILVTCDESNIGSRKVIEACGGRQPANASGSSTVLRYRFG